MKILKIILTLILGIISYFSFYIGCEQQGKNHVPGGFDMSGNPVFYSDNSTYYYIAGVILLLICFWILYKMIVKKVDVNQKL